MKFKQKIKRETNKVQVCKPDITQTHKEVPEQGKIQNTKSNMNNVLYRQREKHKIGNKNRKKAIKHTVMIRVKK